MSEFWKNVKIILDYRSIDIKDLEYRTQIPYSTIINGINRCSMPTADTALKISKVLNKSIESLMGYYNEDKNRVQNFHKQNIKYDLSEIDKYREYEKIIDALESIPANTRESIKELIINIANIKQQKQSRKKTSGTDKKNNKYKLNHK